jgi:GTP:adenosylcobinamide-phosphate guanylyltransferase
MTKRLPLTAAILTVGRARRFGGELDVDEDLIFVNVNTPHDYEGAKRLIEWKPETTQDRITTGRTRPRTDADS